MPQLDRRHVLTLLAVFADLPIVRAATPADVYLMRHARTVPGLGDPPNFRVEACATQRNLSPEGRADAQALAALFAKRGMNFARVLSSRWCRCLDTARLVAGREPETASEALDSFFDEPGLNERRTRALRALIATLPRDAPSLLVTHQVNITALTGIYPRTGEVLVLGRDGDIRVKDRFVA